MTLRYLTLEGMVRAMAREAWEDTNGFIKVDGCGVNANISCRHITPMYTGLYLTPTERTGQHLVRVYDCALCGERIHDDTAPGAPHLYVACRGTKRAPCEGEPWNPPFAELRHLEATLDKMKTAWKKKSV